MKLIYKQLMLLFSLVILSSCGNSWLDLDPTDGVPSETAIDSYKAASVALTGVYDGLQGNSNSVSYYGAQILYYGDVRADDMQARTQGMRTSSVYEMKYNEDNAPQIWLVPYDVIRRANRLLEAIESDKIVDATEAQLKNLKSEALTIRALVHFDLCRIYGKPYSEDNGASLGIPLILEPIPQDALPSRNTVDEVYNQVITDLTDALSEGGLVDKKSYGYVNKWFAEGLLAKVYLYKEDNANALKYAEDVIEKSPYQLWTAEEYVPGWKTTDSGRKEMLFELVNNSTDDWTDRNGIAYLMNEDGYADLIATKSFLDMMAETPEDVRNGIIIPAQSDSILMVKYGEEKIFVNKYPAESNGEMRLNSLPLMRLSEIYLFAAEAAAKLGDGAKASKYLNAIYKRANPNATDLSASEATVERIMLERRKELIGEGHRFFDAMRNNETITRYTGEADKGFHYSLLKESMKFDRSYFRTILPIPIDEVNVNNNLKGQQNPGY